MKKAVYFYLLFTSFITISNESKADSVKDVDGNVYQTVTIGDQTWMVENLKTTKYRNGDVIPSLTDSSTWNKAITGAQCSYNNDEANVSKYGRLYNWYAVSDKRNIAPEGWHVASKNEWQILQSYLILSGYNFDGKKFGENYAKSLASSSDWSKFSREGTVGNNLKKNNSTGFTALPGGWRMKGFEKLNIFGNWWTSTSGYSISLCSEWTSLIPIPWSKSFGLSVRCIKDSKPTLITSSVVILPDSTVKSVSLIYAKGGCKISSRGVCWSTSPQPTISLDAKAEAISKLDSSELFINKITGLTNNKNYYVRAYAKYTYGTTTDVVYGNEQQLTTNFETLPVKDISGNLYHTVKIGNQIWMVENLNTTKFADGSNIDYIKDNEEWKNTSKSALCVYNNQVQLRNKNGLLYNWHAVNDSRKLAPVGWHIPTDKEWATLIKFLGGEEKAGAKLVDTGKKLGDFFNDDKKGFAKIQPTSEDGTKLGEFFVGETKTGAKVEVNNVISITNPNFEGFNALFAGLRSNDGKYCLLGKYASWWSATQNSTLPEAWSISIDIDSKGIARQAFSLISGCSVRCVKD